MKVGAALLRQHVLYIGASCCSSSSSSSTCTVSKQPEHRHVTLQAMLDLWQRQPGLMSKLEAVDHIALHLDATQSAQPPGAVCLSYHQSTAAGSALRAGEQTAPSEPLHLSCLQSQAGGGAF